MGTTSMAQSIWPEISAWATSVELLNGTWTMSAPLLDFRRYKPRCPAEPTPGDPKVYLPGLAFTAAMNSARLLKGNLGLTTRTKPPIPTCPTGSKSFSSSYRVVRRYGRLKRLDEAKRKVYPSAGAAAAAPGPILPPAPARGSPPIGCPPPPQGRWATIAAIA